MGCMPVKSGYAKKPKVADAPKTITGASTPDSSSQLQSAANSAEMELVHELLAFQAMELQRQETLGRPTLHLFPGGDGHGDGLQSTKDSRGNSPPRGRSRRFSPGQQKLALANVICSRRIHTNLQRVASAAGKGLELREVLVGVGRQLGQEGTVLTARDKATIRQTWQDWLDLHPRHAVTLCIFFFRMFLGAPSTRVKFPFLQTVSPEVTVTQLEEACSQRHVRETLDTLSLAVAHLDNLQTISHLIRKIGARHKDYGLASRLHTECFLTGLLYALTKLSETTPNTKTIKAWQRFLNVIKVDFNTGWRRMAVMDDTFSESQDEF